MNCCSFDNVFGFVGAPGGSTVDCSFLGVTDAGSSFGVGGSIKIGLLLDSPAIIRVNVMFKAIIINFSIT